MLDRSPEAALRHHQIEERRFSLTGMDRLAWHRSLHGSKNEIHASTIRRKPHPQGSCPDRDGASHLIDRVPTVREAAERNALAGRFSLEI
jgi:hypothetical protein